MPIPRVRFTVRRLMVAVTAVALLLGAQRRYRENEASYRRALTYHRTNAAFCRFNIETKPPVWVPNPFSLSATDLDRERRRAEYHEAMVLKYERAARHPGLPVAADLPEPE